MLTKEKYFKMKDQRDVVPFNKSLAPQKGKGIYTKVDIVKPDLSWYLDMTLVKRFQGRKDIGKTVPDFMIRDIFKSYYNKNMEYNLVPAMLWWHKILQKVGNYMLKMITQDKISYSYLVTLHILRNIHNVLKEHKGWKTLNNKRNNELKKVMKYAKKKREAKEKDQKREKKGLIPIHEQKLGSKPNEPLLNDPNYIDFMNSLTAGIKTAMNEAGQAIHQLQTLEGEGSGNSSIEMIEEFDKTGKLKDGFPAKALQDFIRQTLSKFKDSGVGKAFYVEESIFEAEEIEDICSYEDFSHIALLLDLTVRSELKNLLFDVYVDVSSSMAGSRCLTKDGSIHMKKIDMAKSLLMKLKRHGFMKNLYVFDTQIKKHDKDRIDSITTCGGTSIDTVLRQAKSLRRPCMILTDCEDGLETSYENAFIMSVEPSIQMSYGMKRMIRSKNVMVYYKGSLSKPVKYTGNGRNKMFHPLRKEELIKQRQ